MPGGLQKHDLTAWNAVLHELSNLLRGDDVLAALKDQRRNRDLGEIASVVGGKGDPRKCLCDFRIGPAEAVGQFLAKFWTVGLPMMEGAIAADQPMWLSSRKSSSSAICFSLKPPM